MKCFAKKVPCTFMSPVVYYHEGVRKALMYHKDLLLVLTHKEIKVRYKNSLLGYFWSLLNPLANMIIFYLVFQVIFQFRGENFVLILLTGLFPWQWIVSYASAATTSFIQNDTLIKKLRFPRYFVPFSMNLQFCFHFVMTLPIIFIVMILYNFPILPIFLVGIPLLLLGQLLLLSGMGLFISTSTMFFRDLENLVAIIMQITFYLTPVLYEFTRIPEHLRLYALLNPFAPFILAWRQLFFEGIISLQLLGAAALHTLVWLVIGVCTFRKLEWKFSEIL